MKTSVQITIAAVLFVLLAGTIAVCTYHHNTHRCMRGMHQTPFSHRQGMNMQGMHGRNMQANMPMRRQMRPAMEQRQMAGMRGRMNRGQMNMMRRGMAPGEMNGMQRGMSHGQMNGMQRSMGQSQMNGMRRGMMPSDSMRSGNMRQDGMIGIMPTLTEKQRKEIAELRQKQQEELSKLRKEMSSKINALVQAQRDKVMALLTPEQRKALEAITRVGEPAAKK